MLNAVIHCNFDDPTRQENGLRNIRNILEDTDGEVDLVVVCHGAGLSLVISEDNGNAETVAELIRARVRFQACENTMQSRSLASESLISGVDTVPSGAVEVLHLQQQGYGYFRP